MRPAANLVRTQGAYQPLIRNVRRAAALEFRERMKRRNPLEHALDYPIMRRRGHVKKFRARMKKRRLRPRWAGLRYARVVIPCRVPQ